MLLSLPIFITTYLAWAAQRCNAADHSRSSTNAGSIKAKTWWASWHNTTFPLGDVSWSKYDSVIYAFASTTPDPSTIGLEDSDKELLPQFVEMAHEHSVHAILSFGGWSGSRYFSSAVATEANRTAFAKAILTVVSQYNLDGIEIDWEYPAKQGIGCNIVSPNDTANLLLFLQNIRAQETAQEGKQKLILSVAVGDAPFIGPDGTPVKDVSKFAEVLDYIDIMNYDVWGGWDATVGPNSPLDDSCAPASYQQGSAVSAVKVWTAAGFPANKIVLGVAGYGHSFHLNFRTAVNLAGEIKLHQPFDKSQQPAGDKWDSTAGELDVCGNQTAVGGIYNFWALIEKGFLRADGTAASGIYYRFDNCSKTPYVYNRTSEVMISYDDAVSFTAKGAYVAEGGLAGFALWEAGSDSKDILLDAIRSGAGIC